MKAIEVTYQIKVSVRRTNSNKIIAGTKINKNVRMLEDNAILGFLDEYEIVKNLRELFDKVESEEGKDYSIFNKVCDDTVNALRDKNY